MPHLEVARRAIQRVPPFDSSGNGYRDTLHWYTVLATADQDPHERIVLVSKDREFTSGNDDLQPALIEEFGKHSVASITLCRDLNGIEVPGHFISPPVDAFIYESSLRERLSALLNGEDALYKIKTSGVQAPDADWILLDHVENLAFKRISSRQVEHQHDAELSFRAIATFVIQANYVVDDDPESLDLVTQKVDIPVVVTGSATALDEGKVGSIRNVEAERRGFDPRLLARTIQEAGRSLDADTRAQIENYLAARVETRLEPNAPDGTE